MMLFSCSVACRSQAEEDAKKEAAALTRQEEAKAILDAHITDCEREQARIRAEHEYFKELVAKALASAADEKLRRERQSGPRRGTV